MGLRQLVGGTGWRKRFENPSTCAGARVAHSRRVKLKSWMMIAAGLYAAAGCATTVAFDDGGTGSGTTGSGGTTPECRGFEDDDGLASVTLRFKNDSPLDVYLPSLCSALDYRVVPSAGDDGIYYGNRSEPCLQTCEELQHEELQACLADACAPTSRLIRPGESFEVVWDGTGLEQGVAMPKACYLDSGNAGSSCPRIVAAEPARYRVDILGYSECMGDCMCDAEGVCWGQPTGQTAYADPIDIDFPSAGTVEIVFGTCAFGCAADQ
jgi:hypothetical protein